MSVSCQPVADDALPSPGRFSTRAQIIAGACACAAGSAILFAVDPHQHGVYPQCLLYNATGIYCAGCGATRAVYALLHGRVIEALHDNLLFVGLLPLLAFWIGPYVLKAWRKQAWPRMTFDRRPLMRRGIALLVLMIGFMLLRNLPGWPFELLRPL